MKSLHDDLNLHDFKRMSAELADGRHAAVEIDEHGHLNIIAVWMPGEQPDAPSYSQQRLMEATREQQTQEQIMFDVSDPFDLSAESKPESNADQMIKEAEVDAKKPKKKPNSAESDPAQLPPARPDGPMPMRIYTGGPNAMQVIESVKMSQQLIDTLMAAHGVGSGDGSAVTSSIEGSYYKSERDPVFLARLQNIMNDNKFDRRLGGRTRGKLDMTRLYKAQAGSAAVFTQKSLRRNKRYNVVLIIDESGSMGDGAFDASRLGIAAISAQFLALHLNKIPGLELMVVGFASQHTVHKHFGETTNLDHLRSKIGIAGLGSGTSPIGALEATYEALKKQPDGHNIVLYLSDGDVDDESGFRHVIKQNAKLGTTVGIGIMHDIAEMTPNFRIDTATELAPLITKTLRKEITRG